MKKKVLKKYVLRCTRFNNTHFFEAEDDEAAERWVEQHFHESDGPMTLSRLEELVEWT
jgi:hypothetical protein